MVVDIQRGCAQIVEIDHDVGVVVVVIVVVGLAVITPASIGRGKLEGGVVFCLGKQLKMVSDPI